MGYVGDSADTAALRRLQLAARAVANARVWGTPAQRTEAEAALDRAKADNTARVAALQEAEAAPGFLEQLRRLLTGAGKLAALALVALLVGPQLVRAARRNPGRRRRRRGR